MICFGAETDEELNKNGHVGPTFNKIKKKHKNITKEEEETGGAEFVFLFYSLISLFDLWKSNRQNSSRQEAMGSTR